MSNDRLMNWWWRKWKDKKKSTSWRFKFERKHHRISTKSSWWRLWIDMLLQGLKRIRIRPQDRLLDNNKSELNHWWMMMLLMSLMQWLSVIWKVRMRNEKRCNSTVCLQCFPLIIMRISQNISICLEFKSITNLTWILLRNRNLWKEVKIYTWWDQSKDQTLWKRVLTCDQWWIQNQKLNKTMMTLLTFWTKSIK